jgi:hypothetical protein
MSKNATFHSQKYEIVKQSNIFKIHIFTFILCIDFLVIILLKSCPTFGKQGPLLHFGITYFTVECLNVGKFICCIFRYFGKSLLLTFIIKKIGRVNIYFTTFSIFTIKNILSVLVHVKSCIVLLSIVKILSVIESIQLLVYKLYRN